MEDGKENEGSNHNVEVRDLAPIVSEAPWSHSHLERAQHVRLSHDLLQHLLAQPFNSRDTSSSTLVQSRWLSVSNFEI